MSSGGPGLGSQFRVIVSRVVTPDPSIDRAGDSPVRERPCAVLVVDDNADAVHTLRDLLELRGHRVTVAFTAADAWQRALELRPDVGLLDLGLPDVDGLTLVRRLRQEPATSSMLLVAITGRAQADDRERAIQAGFDAHITKPAHLEALVALMAAGYPAEGHGATAAAGE